MKKLSIIIPLYNQEDLIIKALDSIPLRDDLEIIVIDDASEDDSFINVRKYIENHEEKDIILLYNVYNQGVAKTVNRGIDVSTGEYILLLGSDDYLITDEFLKSLKELDGTDLIYFNLKVNSGAIWEVNNITKNNLVGSVKYMRREFIGETRNPDLKAGEDYEFYKELLCKKPTEKFTNLTIKHYNYPREGSLTQIYVLKP